MQALTIAAHGALDRIELSRGLSVPELGRPDDVRIRGRAAALNRLDLFVIAGLPGVTITPPWTLGGDACGEVESVGSAVTDLRPGDYVVVNPGISDRTQSAVAGSNGGSTERR